MTDLPLSRLSHAQREQRELVKARDRMRKLRQRERMERADAGYSHAATLPPTTILQDWHTDEHGCRARRVGCEGR